MDIGLQSISFFVMLSEPKNPIPPVILAQAESSQVKTQSSCLFKPS